MISLCSEAGFDRIRLPYAAAAASAKMNWGYLASGNSLCSLLNHVALGNNELGLSGFCKWSVCSLLNNVALDQNELGLPDICQ